MNNVCDDVLISLVGQDLAKVGIILPVSEVETLAVQRYDDFVKANKDYGISSRFNSDNKDARYYSIMKCLICARVIATRRLAKTKDQYEISAFLILLQGYLDTIAKAMNMNKIDAQEAFADFIDNGSIDDGLPKINLQKIKSKADNKSVCRLCTNSPEADDINPCEVYEEDNLHVCEDYVCMSLFYKGICFGFRVDPEILNFNKDIYKDELPEHVQITKNMIDKAATCFKNKASDIFVAFYQVHNE